MKYKSPKLCKLNTDNTIMICSGPGSSALTTTGEMCNEGTSANPHCEDGVNATATCFGGTNGASGGDCTPGITPADGWCRSGSSANGWETCNTGSIVAVGCSVGIDGSN
ncbi:MAG TPA: hypothetical protein QF753_19235 [Victivallales bacterium]|nr:hypothetical protein [Victivallales bacterium]